MTLEIFYVLLISAAAGALLGVFYFGGLWWTVLRMTTAQNAGILFAVSFLLRILVVIAGFFLISGGDWQRLLAALVGFMLVRHLIIRKRIQVNEKAT